MAGIHPDIIRVRDEEKDITVAQIRALRSDAYIRPKGRPGSSTFWKRLSP